MRSSRTSFIGRQAEREVVAGALLDHPLVTIFGTGGVGKTRLALEVAANSEWAADGVWLIELGALREGTQVRATVATALGIGPRVGQSVEESVVDWCASNRALIVIDNCEHVLGDVATLLQAVLARRPATVVLATSREPLMIDGEHVVALGPLPLPIDSQGDSDAVRLFVGRARDEAPQFDADTDRAAIVEICVRLDGIPLAIELAAARMRALSPREVADRLQERFRILTGGWRTATERQKTLRATVEWSYKLLDDEQRRCFDRLSIFAGAFGLDDVAAVVADTGIDEWAMLDVLSALVDRSLVVRTPDERYRLLETLRAYGEERCASTGISDVLRNAHARWFHSKALSAKDVSFGPDEVTTLDGIVSQIADYDIAMSWSLDNDEWERAVEIAFSLHECMARYQLRPMSTMTSVARLLAEPRWTEPNLGYPSQLTQEAVVLALNFASGWLYAMEGDTAGARTLSKQAVELDPANSFGHAILSHTALTLGETRLALGPARAAFQYAAQHPARRLTAYLYMGYALAALGRAEEARAVAVEFRDWSEQVCSKCALAWSHLLLGTIESSFDPQQALRHLEAGIRIARATSALAAEHFIQRQRIALLLDVSLAEARNISSEVLEHCRETGDLGNLPMFLCYDVIILHRLGDNDNAARISGGVDISGINSDEAELLDDTVQQLRACLGPHFASLQREGTAMDLIDLINVGLAALSPGEIQCQDSGGSDW